MANVIITGANRGLGLGILRSLAEQPPIKPLLIVACARQPPSSTDFQTHPDCTIQWHSLDISSRQSVMDLAAAIGRDCPDGVDVLINNAGTAIDRVLGHGVAAATQTINVNFEGTLAMCQAFTPMMRRPGLEALGGRSRIVNISSTGSMHLYSSETVLKEFREAETIEAVRALGNEYIDAVRTGSEERRGWPKSKSYNISKGMLNASTRVLASENAELLVNCCCPGWLQTDMGRLGGSPPKKVEEGIKIPLRLAFGAIEQTGLYWENPSVFDTGSGRPTPWGFE